MNSQPKWDIYESVVLLNGYLYYQACFGGLTSHGHTSRAED